MISAEENKQTIGRSFPKLKTKRRTLSIAGNRQQTQISTKVTTFILDILEDPVLAFLRMRECDFVCVCVNNRRNKTNGFSDFLSNAKLYISSLHVFFVCLFSLIEVSLEVIR